MLRIASKPQNGRYEFPCSVTVVQYLALWRNSYAYLIMVVSCSRWSRAWLPIWNFWSQISKFRLHFEALGFFWKSKEASQKLAVAFLFFFVLKSLALAKHCLSRICTTNIFWLMYLIRNKCTTVYLRGKTMLQKIGIAFYGCFWQVLISIFVWLHMFHCMCSLYVLGLLSV